MSLEILGIGTATPDHSIDQADAAAIAVEYCGAFSEQARLLPALYRRSGVRRRHSVVLEGSKNGNDDNRQSFYAPAESADDRGPTTSRRMQMYDRSAAPLGSAAAMAALQNAGVSPTEVTHLVTVSCSGFSAPGFDVALIGELRLPVDVARTHVGFMGCHGALNGLRLAKAFADADSAACVLLCAVELCSLHHQYGWNADTIVANSLFADGAAAVVARCEVPGDVGKSPGSAHCSLAASGSVVIPDSAEMMSWNIGDNGFEMTLSPRVPDLIHRHLREWLERWLGRQELTVSDVGSWAVHPGGPRILTAIGKAAGLDRDLLACSREVLAEYGNMSSPTVLFILDRLQREHSPRPYVMLAFGPGLTIEAALIR